MDFAYQSDIRFGKSAWARRLRDRRRVNVAAVALAAKHARIAFDTGEHYDIDEVLNQVKQFISQRGYYPRHMAFSCGNTQGFESVLH
jgi:hypothetical protein